jgi:hypothetical protein
MLEVAQHTRAQALQDTQSTHTCVYIPDETIRLRACVCVVSGVLAFTVCSGTRMLVATNRTPTTACSARQLPLKGRTACHLGSRGR